MWDGGPQPNPQCSLPAAASAGGEVWAGAVAGGSTPGSRAGSRHRALPRGSCPPTAGLLPAGRERLALSPRRGTPTFLASWPHHGTKFVPACLPLAWPALQRFGDSCSRGWEELPAPLQMLGSCRWPRRAPRVPEDNVAARHVLHTGSPGHAGGRVKSCARRRFLRKERLSR